MKQFKVKRTPNKQKPEFQNPNNYSFIIGNGTTRKGFDLEDLMNYGMLVGCNYFYRDLHPHVLVLSDEGITNTVAKVDKAWMMRNHVFSWYPKGGGKIKKVAFPEKTSAGLMAVYEAIETFNQKNIFLIGMDFFGLGSKGSDDNGKINNMYAGKKHYQPEGVHAPTYRNWQRRFRYLLQQYPDVNFYHVAPLDGRSPERLIGAPNFHQVSWENLQDHLHNDAELIDMKKISDEDVELFLETNPDDLRAQIERQFASQENFIFPDKIDPQQLLNIRLNCQRQYRMMGPDKASRQLLSVHIKEFDITVPPLLIQTRNGLVIADDEFLVNSYKKECKERYDDMGIELKPFRKLTSGVDQRQMGEAPPAPPPPPPKFDLPPPPPPPPMVL